MPERYEPFRGIRRVQELLLVESAPNGSAVDIVDEPYYAEICAWVNIRCGEEDLFSPSGQVLLEGLRDAEVDWRLLLTPYGYLRFEACGQGAFVSESVLPVHACVDCAHAFRLGLAMGNYAAMLRDTPYTQEAAAYSRLRLLGGAPDGPLHLLGGSQGPLPTDLRPVPEQLRVPWCAGSGETAESGGERAARDGRGGAERRSRADGGGRSGVFGIVAYNTDRIEAIEAARRPGAAEVLPIVPGGGGFEPNWLDEHSLEVFTRPEFTQTSSYWVLLRLVDPPARLQRLRIWTIWHGGANMTPTFFWSPEGAVWERIVPAAVHMDPAGRDFRVEFDITPEMLRGGLLASGPVFGDAQRGELLRWASAQRHTTVSRIGLSAGGRPLHCIRVGAGPDGSGRPGVAIVCGQHSPLETMGARVLKPLIARLVANGGLAQTGNLYLVPTVNVDCAHYGGNGLNQNRRNTNRHWMEDIQPENAAVIGHFDALRQKGQSIDFALDIHAGGIFRNHVLMPMGPGEGATPTEESLSRQERLLDLLERHAGLRREDGWALPQMRLRATDYFHQRFGCPALCLEISSCSYFDPAESRTKAFGTDAFEVLARGLAETLEEYLGLS